MDCRTRFRTITLRGARTRQTPLSFSSLFTQSWWRNHLGRSPDYREEIVLRDGRPIASLSYALHYDRIVGFPWAVPPPLSCRNGPFFAEGLSEHEKTTALRLLLARLRRRPVTSYVFTCETAAPDAALVRREFLQAGFQHQRPLNPARRPGQAGLLTPQPGDNPATNRRRSHIRNARARLDLIDAIDPGEFLAFYRDNLQARGKTRSYLRLPLALPLLTEGVASGRIRLLATRRRGAQPGGKAWPWDAAIAIAADRPLGDNPAGWSAEEPGRAAAGRCYLLLVSYRIPPPGTAQDKPVADANKVLILQAAELAVSHGLIFDTGGWATPGARTFYRRLFPSAGSIDCLDVFRKVWGPARWYNCRRLLLKKRAARYGITQLTPSRYNLRILGRLLAARLAGRPLT